MLIKLIKHTTFIKYSVKWSFILLKYYLTFRIEIFLAAYIPFFFCFLQLGDLLNMVFLGSTVRPLYDNGLKP